MAIVKTLVWSVWLLLLSGLTAFGSQDSYRVTSFCLGTSAANSAFVMAHYDEHAQATFGYDGGLPVTFAYDSTATPTSGREANRTDEASASFANFAKFLAADSGGSFRLSEAGGGNSLPRTLETVSQYANQGGIGLDGITVRIIDDSQLEGRGLFGYTPPSGTEIHLYPDAFESEQSLVETLGHERTHVYQFQTFGPTVNANTVNAELFEKAAVQSESSFYQYFLSNGGGQ